ncbi:hypothetical protein BH24ACT11_BH24ACT11_19690 [soil metagenome]
MSRVIAGQQVHLHVSGDGPLHVGDSAIWRDTLCRRMSAGAAYVVPDVGSDPNYADLELGWHR